MSLFLSWQISLGLSITVLTHKSPSRSLPWPSMPAYWAALKHNLWQPIRFVRAISKFWNPEQWVNMSKSYLFTRIKCGWEAKVANSFQLRKVYQSNFQLRKVYQRQLFPASGIECLHRGPRQASLCYQLLGGSSRPNIQLYTNMQRNYTLYN